MSKKLLFISVFLVLLLGCPRSNKLSTDMCISGITATFVPQPIMDSAYYLQMGVSGEVAYNGFPDFGFGNSAYAIILPVGQLCRSVKDITVTSNRDFNSIPAGQDLGGKLVVSSNGTEAFVNLLPFSMQKGSVFLPGYYFRFTETPLIKNHEFTIVLTDSKNQQFTASTGEIIWE
ncbi:MAG: hypothetical protein K1X92_03400 [Bacteroidia bacterium]|nr:hypothetical protein [Bacteroidia bacterium]